MYFGEYQHHYDGYGQCRAPARQRHGRHGPAFRRVVALYGQIALYHRHIGVIAAKLQCGHDEKPHHISAVVGATISATNSGPIEPPKLPPT